MNGNSRDQDNAKTNKNGSGDKRKNNEPNGSNGGDPTPATARETLLLVSSLVLFFLLMVGILLAFWPEEGQEVAPVALFGLPLGSFGLQARLFILVVAAGALGSFIHVATSAGDYIGNRKLFTSWIYWYILRLPVGGGLSLLVYLLLRGGVLEAPSANESHYGIIGLAALAGMFAKKATNKLGELFETIFRTGRDDALKDKVGTEKPVLSALDPASLAVNAADLMIQIKGEHFQNTTQVKVNGSVRHSKFVNDKELSLLLMPADVAQAGQLKVQLETPGVPEPSDALDLEVK